MVNWDEVDDERKSRDGNMGLEVAEGSMEIWGGTLNRLHEKIDSFIESIPNAIDVEYDHPEWDAGFHFSPKNLIKEHRGKWSTDVRYTRYIKLPYNFIDRSNK